MRTLMSIAALTTVSMFAACHAKAQLPAGCGDASTQFKVKTAVMPLGSNTDVGTARVVLIPNLTGSDFNNMPTTRLAVDGKWVGAVRGNSFTAATVTPGAHTVCVSRQGRSAEERSNAGSQTVQLAPGETYYLQFTIDREPTGGVSQHAGGYITGKSGQDMSAKDSDTYDTAHLAPIEKSEAWKQIGSLRMSMATPK